MAMESKAKVRARLNRSGHWSEFVHHMDDLKRGQGMTGLQAWREARRRFQPGMLPPSGLVRIPELHELQEQPYTPEGGKPVQGVELAGGEGVGAVFPTDQVDDDDGDGAVESGLSHSYSRLLKAGQRADKLAERLPDEREVVRWVLSNLLVPLRRIRADTVPCAYAVTLLEWAKRDEGNRTEFVVKFGLKMLPTKTQADLEAGYDESGRTVEQLFADWESSGFESADAFSQDRDAILSIGAEDAG